MYFVLSLFCVNTTAVIYSNISTKTFPWIYGNCVIVACRRFWHTHIRTHMLTGFIVFTVSILEFNNLDTKIDGKNISRELL